MAITVGLIQLAMAIFRIGIISVLLPKHLISGWFSNRCPKIQPTSDCKPMKGFTCGVAYHVMTSQVRVLLGLTREFVPRTEGPGSFFVTWINILKNLPNAAVPSVVISVISIAIVWLTKWLSRRYSKKLKKLPIPGELFLVIGTMTIIN